MNIFITGASSGLGEALALLYAERGAVLGLLARRRDKLETLAYNLAEKTTVRIYQGDVCDRDAVQYAADDFMASFGVPDIVIANAGVSYGTVTGGSGDGDLPVFREVINTNLLGMVYTFHSFVDTMRQARAGTLVGVASIAGYRGLPGSGGYSASKAAAIAYLESLRVDLQDSGVSVVTLCPGFVDTPMTRYNPYPMPFLITAQKAAQLMIRAIDRKKRCYLFPWQMMLIGKMLPMIPDSVFDAFFRFFLKRVSTKPRKDLPHGDE
ncbi:MAG: SDR family oxidoreductase [Burkholderiales bacterium]|jgi:short-subunit dehydrogenase|nr:SDR family oxidoreductase [Burkholderiales bacterium]